MLISELCNYIDSYLEVPSFSDASLNGLQIEGSKECRKIVTAVTASLEAIDAAIELGADTLLVHHGLFWKGQMHPITGCFKDRISSILNSNLNLIAYHLPLDAHIVVGNNRCLCDAVGLEDIDYIEQGNQHSIAMQGHLNTPLSVKQIALKLSCEMGAKIDVLGCFDENQLISSVAVCSGSGSFLVDSNMNPKFDALITGDVNEQTFHISKETATPVFAIGHDASEQCGIRALGEHLGRRFGLEHHHLTFNVENEIKSFNGISDR